MLIVSMLNSGKLITARFLEAQNYPIAPQYPLSLPKFG
jgi:hypothetical protein